MEQKSMTAMVSAFSRAYHSSENETKIFDDYLARKIIGEENYNSISDSMAKGIGFFNPTFHGTESEALRWVVDNQLSPTPLGRAAFCERSLETAVRIGALQYIILGAGYDSFAYRQPKWAQDIEIFEVDHPLTAQAKREALANAQIKIPLNVHYIAADLITYSLNVMLGSDESFIKEQISFISMLGLTYYLDKQDFVKIIIEAATVVPGGSTIVFDYPDEKSNTAEAGERAKKQAMLAAGSGEKMFPSYSYNEMEKLLAENGFMIYEHLTPDEITNQFFDSYNNANPQHRMSAFDNVNYCLAVREM